MLPPLAKEERPVAGNQNSGNTAPAQPFSLRRTAVNVQPIMMGGLLLPGGNPIQTAPVAQSSAAAAPTSPAQQVPSLPRTRVNVQPIMTGSPMLSGSNPTQIATVAQSSDPVASTPPAEQPPPLPRTAVNVQPIMMGGLMLPGGNPIQTAPVAQSRAPTAPAPVAEQQSTPSGPRKEKSGKGTLPRRTKTTNIFNTGRRPPAAGTRISPAAHDRSPQPGSSASSQSPYPRSPLSQTVPLELAERRSPGVQMISLSANRELERLRLQQDADRKAAGVDGDDY